MKQGEAKTAKGEAVKQVKQFLRQLQKTAKLLFYIEQKRVVGENINVKETASPPSPPSPYVTVTKGRLMLTLELTHKILYNISQQDPADGGAWYLVSATLMAEREM